MKKIYLLSVALAAVLAGCSSNSAKDAASKASEATQNVAKSAVDTAKEKAAEAVEATKEAAAAAVDAAKEKTAEAVDAVKEEAAKAVDTTKEKAAEVADAAKEKAAEAVEATKEKAAEVVRETKEKVADEEAAMSKPSQSTPAADPAKGKSLYAKCAGCHGANGQTKALGKSDPIAGLDVATVTADIKGYQAGTLNKHGMGALMKGQVAGMSEEDIAAVSSYISSLK